MKDRIVTFSLNKAKEWYKKGGELKEVALQAYSEEELIRAILPETWEEFCRNNPITINECRITEFSKINTCINMPRDKTINKNILPSFKAAQQHLAFMQLHQLRDCFRKGWVPDFTDDTLKHVICLIGGIPVVTTIYGTSNFLSFQTKKLAEEFLNNFKDLIIEAGDLI